MIPVTQKPASPRSAVARPKTGETPVRTTRMPSPDWEDIHALAGRKLATVLWQFARWYLRKPGAKLPERPSAERIAEVVQERETRERALVAKYLSGITVHEIAKREKLNDKSIRDTLRRHGVDA
jgi:hypothetical protein